VLEPNVQEEGSVDHSVSSVVRPIAASVVFQPNLRTENVLGSICSRFGEILRSSVAMFAANPCRVQEPLTATTIKLVTSRCASTACPDFQSTQSLQNIKMKPRLQSEGVWCLIDDPNNVDFDSY